MNQEIKTKWVAALRSGEYTQFKGKLADPRNPKAFCCLGVLCEILVESHGVHKHSGTEVVSFDEETGLLPYSVMGAAEISYHRLTVEVEIPGQRGRHFTLPMLNDHHNFTFNQIADLIEAQL